MDKYDLKRSLLCMLHTRGHNVTLHSSIAQDART